MTRQNPGPDRAPGPPTRNSHPISPSHTDLSYSDRVRNMVRAGESGSGHSGILRAKTSPPAPNSPTPPHSQVSVTNCACALNPFSPPSYTCLLLVGRSSRRGDWANALPPPSLEHVGPSLSSLSTCPAFGGTPRFSGSGADFLQVLCDGLQDSTWEYRLSTW
ncbi:hypothetical protein J1605_008006 [Eschrichtius robustus]|uniref:Uncharacterized protein n=1 Tax=Eschrichtius robustus TaxID=9764 RepID=A0AB34H190_ESCRO|nr:hypothetical protein J1605_008006 [Eschrichtius robustus]